jgi:hypothetical protein
MRRKRRTFNVQPIKSRAELEAFYGEVWSTEQLARTFIVTAIIGSTLVVRRKCDDTAGTVEVQEGPPQFYFKFTPQPVET